MDACQVAAQQLGAGVTRGKRSCQRRVKGSGEGPNLCSAPAASALKGALQQQREVWQGQGGRGKSNHAWRVGQERKA